MTRRAPLRLLGAVRLWGATGAIVGLLASLFAFLYIAPNADPADHLRRLPVGLVNADTGLTAEGARLDLGDKAARTVERSSAGVDSIDWRVMSLEEVYDELGTGHLYGALVIPADFTASVGALTHGSSSGPPARPALTVLTNSSAGGMGSTFARIATTTAAQGVSQTLGTQLTQQAAAARPLTGTERLLLTDPLAISIEDGHPLDPHSGLGLTAFYYALALVVSGMLAANVVSGRVDHALGFTHDDLGPIRRRRELVGATRVERLAASNALMLGLSVPMATLSLAGGVAAGMDTPHAFLLWVFSVAVIAATGVGALSLLAAFGTPGMLVVALVFVAMSVPTAGATVPLEALPGFFRVLSEFEPLRQVTGAVRSILYYDAQGDAGLTRGWLMVGFGLASACVFGFGTTRLYDRINRNDFKEEVAA
jgi:YhgE/Pip-like protein